MQHCNPKRREINNYEKKHVKKKKVNSFNKHHICITCLQDIIKINLIKIEQYDNSLTNHTFKTNLINHTFNKNLIEDSKMIVTFCQIFNQPHIQNQFN